MIIAKSALCEKAMQRKMDLKADKIEVQLLNELLTSNLTDVSEAFPDFEKCLKFPVYSVHTPLVKYPGYDATTDIPLETLVTNPYINIFENVCKIANTFGKKQNELVWIVIHSSLSSETLTSYDKDIMDVITDVLDIFLNKYEYIGVAIENVTPVKKISKNGIITTSNAFLYDNVDIVKFLKNKMPLFKSRFATVLDTCHVEMSIQFLKMMAKLFDNEPINIPTMEDYFKANAETIKFMHLSKTIANGEGKGRHGQPFQDTKADKEYIKNILNLKNKYCKNCDIVLEVAEKDYSVSDGFNISNTILKDILKEQN